MIKKKMKNYDLKDNHMETHQIPISYHHQFSIKYPDYTMCTIHSNCTMCTVHITKIT